MGKSNIGGMKMAAVHRIFLPLLLILLCCTACGKRERAEYFAMDTVITMELSGRHAEEGLELAREELLRLDDLLAIRGERSEIAALNAGEISRISGEIEEVLSIALDISKATGGAYDCTIQPVVELWGWYDAQPSVPNAEQLAKALKSVGFDGLSVENSQVIFSREGMGIDLGGIGKGYAAGKLVELLHESGVTSGWISLGGNVHVIGSKQGGKPWSVGIADPNHPSAYLCTVAVKDQAVVTSGDYQRCFEEDGVMWHHILDPRTGYSAGGGLRSVTIVCEDDTLADGLSTALFVMGTEDALEFWRSGVYEFEAVLICEDGILVTEGLEKGFACQTDYEVVHR